MAIDTNALRETILKGANLYLKETQFSDGLFAKHGKDGKTTATKIKSLLENNTIADDPVRILIVAKTIFNTPFTRPTLKKYIFQAIAKEEKLDCFATASQMNDWGRFAALEIKRKIAAEIKGLNADIGGTRFELDLTTYLHHAMFVNDSNLHDFFQPKSSVPQGNKIHVESPNCVIL